MNVKIIKEFSLPLYSGKEYEALEDGIIKLETDQPSWGIPELKWMSCAIKKGMRFQMQDRELTKNPHLIIHSNQSR